MARTWSNQREAVSKWCIKGNGVFKFLFDSVVVGPLFFAVLYVIMRKRLSIPFWELCLVKILFVQ